MPKRVKMADPNKVYFSPQNGIVVQGNAVVEFPDPVHQGVLLKIALGALRETDEAPSANTHKISDPASNASTPRWVGKTLPGQVIVLASGAPAPAQAMPIKGKKGASPGSLDVTAQVLAEKEEAAKQSATALVAAQAALDDATKVAEAAHVALKDDAGVQSAKQGFSKAQDLYEYAHDQLKAAQEAASTGSNGGGQ